MSGPTVGRAKTALGLLAIAATAASWSGCGSDDVDQATNDIKEQAEQIKGDAQQAGEDIKDEAQQLEDEVTGDDETTTTTTSTSAPTDY